MTTQMLRKPFASFIVGSSLLALTGCGGDGMTLYPVGGTITKNSEPLAGAAVIFVPESPDGSNAASQAITGPDGKYTLKTNEVYGAPAGKFKVMISMAPPIEDVPEAFKNDPSMATMAPDAGKKKPKKGDKAEPVNETISDVEIVAGKNEPKDFDVKAVADPAKP